MSVASNWVGSQGWKLVESCRESGATIIQVIASLCLSGCL